jgi:hypothetical protein
MAGVPAPRESDIRPNWSILAAVEGNDKPAAIEGCYAPMPRFALECRLSPGIPLTRISVKPAMRTSFSFTIGPALLLVMLGAAGTGCSGPATPSGGTYTLTGNVKSRTTLEPLTGATVEVTSEGTNGVPKTVTVTADTNGEFSVGGLKDYVTVHVTKAGFYPGLITVLLDRDQRTNVLMDLAAPLLPEGGDLTLGKTVHSTIGPADPKCEPQWDSKSPCRLFGITVDVTRSYQFSFVQSSRCGELEIHVLEGGSRAALGSGKNTWVFDANLVANRNYVIRLMAYYECEWFELTVR